MKNYKLMLVRKTLKGVLEYGLKTGKGSNGNCAKNLKFANMTNDIHKPESFLKKEPHKIR